MKYLGIDYGLKKVGISISEGVFASPYKTLQVSGLKDALQQILAIIKKEEIKSLVIGVAESGESRKIVKSFIAELKKNSGINIIEADETLSTMQAKERLLEIKGPRNKKDDSMSAAIILQNHLDSLN